LTKKIFHSDVGIPMVVYIVDADEGINKNIMVYGHLDKQPYGVGWITDPCDPVIKGNLLYGRGASDDGYAPFSCMLGVKAA
jgi:acetylornithine deacetylase/succinyl-diaminopimelate desuccinylase-like protein